jgi:hypothetical protein
VDERISIIHRMSGRYEEARLALNRRTMVRLLSRHALYSREADRQSPWVREALRYLAALQEDGHELPGDDALASELGRLAGGSGPEPPLAGSEINGC